MDRWEAVLARRMARRLSLIRAVSSYGDGGPRGFRILHLIANTTFLAPQPVISAAPEPFGFPVV